MTKALPGINVQAPWASLLLEEKKSIETRTYPLPEKYVKQDLWLIETPGRLGQFKARVIGVIKFSGFKQYNSLAEFQDDFDLHLVRPDDPNYAWRNGVAKYGWIVEQVRPVDIFTAPTPRGIVYSKPFDHQARF